MPINDARMRLYHLNADNRKLGRKMMQSLKLTRKGEYEQASRLLSETRREYEQLRMEQKDILKDSLRRDALKSEHSLGFTEVFHDSIAQANLLHSRSCPAVKFHVYN